MKKAILPCLLLIAALLAVSGCQSPRTAGMSVDVSTQTEAGELDHHITFDSVSFARHLQFTGISCQQNSLGQLLAQVELRNLDSRDYTALYAFAWFDGNGMEIEPGQVFWHPITFVGGQRLTLQQTSTYPNAVDFRLMIRPGRNVK